MNIHLFLLPLLVPILSACSRESRENEPEYALEIKFSEDMAHDGKAQSILSIIHGTLTEGGTIRGITLTLSVAARTVKVICISQYGSSGIEIDQMVIRIGESTIALNDEQMDIAELKKRLQQYKKAADLTSSVPVPIVEFDSTANINDMIDGFVAVAESGIRHITLH